MKAERPEYVIEKMKAAAAEEEEEEEETVEMVV
jgi:hypothetical protein